MTYDNDAYDAQARSHQIDIAAVTSSLTLQQHIAAKTEDVSTLIALARNLSLHPSVQTVIANNEHGLSLLDRGNPLSSAHAHLLARTDLELYPARLIMEENTPEVREMILANLSSAVVKNAAEFSNVAAYRALV